MKPNKIGADVIKKYRDAIIDLKSLTQKAEGELIVAIPWCAKHKVSTYILPAMIKLDYLTKGKDSTNAQKNRYTWKAGYIDILDKNVVKIIELTRKLQAVKPGRVGNNTPTITKVDKVDKTLPRVLALKEGYFTSQHFKTMDHITFHAPFTVKVDEDKTVKNTRKITFEVDKSDLLMHFLIHPLNDNEAKESEFIEVLTVKFTNKAIMFSKDDEAQSMTVQGHNYY